MTKVHPCQTRIASFAFDPRAKNKFTLDRIHLINFRLLVCLALTLTFNKQTNKQHRKKLCAKQFKEILRMYA